MRLRSLLARSLTVIGLACTALAFNNTYGDNIEVARSAERVACGGPCIKSIRMERTPLAQSFVFQTSLVLQTTVAVECRREFVLLGDYRCELLAGAP